MSVPGSYSRWAHQPIIQAQKVGDPTAVVSQGTAVKEPTSSTSLTRDSTFKMLSRVSTPSASTSSQSSATNELQKGMATGTEYKTSSSFARGGFSSLGAQPCQPTSLLYLLEWIPSLGAAKGLMPTRFRPPQETECSPQSCKDRELLVTHDFQYAFNPYWPSTSGLSSNHRPKDSHESPDRGDQPSWQQGEYRSSHRPALMAPKDSEAHSPNRIATYIRMDRFETLEAQKSSRQLDFRSTLSRESADSHQSESVKRLVDARLSTSDDGKTTDRVTNSDECLASLRSPESSPTFLANADGPIFPLPALTTVEVEPDNHFRVPRTWTFLRKAGSGAYGTVAAFRDEPNGGRTIAVKKVTRAFSDLIDARRVLREIRILRQLSHPNVIRLIDLVACESIDFDDIYICSELMDTDLHRVIHSSQNLTEEHVRFFLKQLLFGIKYIHDRGLMHRDIKPSNILVNVNCTLKICDFGLARAITTSEASPLSMRKPPRANKLKASTTFHMTDYVVTRWYRPPEILLGFHDYGPEVDIWSLGCVFGELLKREALFGGENQEDQISRIARFASGRGQSEWNWINDSMEGKKARRLLSQISREPPISIAELVPCGTDSALDLLNAMLQIDPSKRLSIENALQHPYLAGCSLINPGPQAPALLLSFPEGSVFPETSLEVPPHSDIQIHRMNYHNEISNFEIPVTGLGIASVAIPSSPARGSPLRPRAPSSSSSSSCLYSSGPLGKIGWAFDSIAPTRRNLQARVYQDIALFHPGVLERDKPLLESRGMKLAPFMSPWRDSSTVGFVALLHELQMDVPHTISPVAVSGSLLPRGSFLPGTSTSSGRKTSHSPPTSSRHRASSNSKTKRFRPKSKIPHPASPIRAALKSDARCWNAGLVKGRSASPLKQQQLTKRSTADALRYLMRLPQIPQSNASGSISEGFQARGGGHNGDATSAKSFETSDGRGCNGGRSSLTSERRSCAEDEAISIASSGSSTSLKTIQSLDFELQRGNPLAMRNRNPLTPSSCLFVCNRRTPALQFDGHSLLLRKGPKKMPESIQSTYCGSRRSANDDTSFRPTFSHLTGLQFMSVPEHAACSRRWEPIDTHMPRLPQRTSPDVVEATTTAPRTAKGEKAHGHSFCVPSTGASISAIATLEKTVAAELASQWCLARQSYNIGRRPLGVGGPRQHMRSNGPRIPLMATGITNPGRFSQQLLWRHVTKPFHSTTTLLRHWCTTGASHMSTTTETKTEQAVGRTHYLQQRDKAIRRVNALSNTAYNNVPIEGEQYTISGDAALSQTQQMLRHYWATPCAITLNLLS